jgi:putative ABC transport system permease protein
VWRVTVRGLFAHKVRLVATALAVLLGVAFVTGTNVLAGSVSTSFDRIFSDVYRDIDAVVRSSVQIDTPFGAQRARVDESLVASASRASGVQAVEGQVEGDLRVIGRDREPVGADQGPPTLGLNWLTQPSLNRWTIVDDGRPPTAVDEVVLDERTADEGGYAVGDIVDIAVQEGVVPFRLVGLAEFEGDSSFELHAALFETTTAQRFVAEPGKFDFISIVGDAGVSQEDLSIAVGSVMPPEAQVITGEAFIVENQDVFAKFIGLIEQALLVFGYVALGVGAFIIYNTFAIIIAQRTRELALLRALGARRRQIAISVVLEAFAVGVVASGIGIGLGILIGIGLKAVLESLGFGPTSIPTVIRSGDIALAVAIGTVVTTLSALVPAFRASRVSPLAALREVAYEHGRISWARTATGVLLVATGVLLILRALHLLTEDELLNVGQGAAVAFVGVVVLGPVLARPLSRVLGTPLPWLGRVTGRLARENAMRSPRRTAATASALMIGVGLVGFIAVVAASFQASIASAVERTVGADLVVNPQGGGGGPGNALSPALADELARSPVVDVVATQRLDFAEVAGSGQIVVAIDPHAFSQIVELDVVEGSLDDLDAGGIAVPRHIAEHEGWQIGTPLPARFLQQTDAVLPVVAIYQTDLPFAGAGLFIGQDLFDRTFPVSEHVDDIIYLKLTPGVTGAEGAAAIQTIVDRYPTAKVLDLDQFKQEQIDEINQFLAVIYALLALALIIAIIGIVNTLLLSVHERTHELGLLRAIGMSRGQVGSSVCWEAVLIALIGTVTGLAVAIFFGWAIVRALYEEGARLFAVPVTTMIAIVVLAAVAALLAALYPAFRAARLNVLDAIATE